MKRRDLLKSSAALGMIAAIPFSRAAARVDSQAVPNPLKPPAQGSIPVAFLIPGGAVLIDFMGPWEVFGSVMIHGRMDFFQLYTVGETTKPNSAGEIFRSGKVIERSSTRVRKHSILTSPT